ncbi:MAG: MMPL family transporter [Pseudomonadales bacterium]|nr:efflux RND transporter permease subunit [Pseudomonadales bacterium]NIX08798.1 MMPL family transporter [Pseudomonadales bacterium]
MITRFAQHRVAANLTMIMMTLAGLWAIRSMPSQLDPPASFPLVFVQIQWVGASAEDVESLVTTPIEQQLKTLNDLKELASRTENGSVAIWAQFHQGADMTLALDQVKQRVANIRNLPPDIEPPTIARFKDLEPIASLLLTGPGQVSELIPIARDMERALMARGVEAVRYDGLPAEEIALLVPGRRLHELDLTLNDLAREVSRVSRNVPAGTVGSGQGSRQLRSLDQRRDPLGFEQLHLTSADQIVRIGDIAEVVRRPQRGQPMITSGGRPAIEMTLMRSTEADAYQADQMLDGWLAEQAPALPEGVRLERVFDVWDLLGAQLDMIAKNGLSGLVLVVLTLFLFLNGRVGWWVMVGIPVSFLMGLALFHLVFGHGISIIALIGFIMALGIVVDDAIVVGEDAATHFAGGKTPMDAAVSGARRMWVPVVTSSLTTLAAFIPLLLIGGPMGDIILVLPTVLLCIIAASLMECFLVLPSHLRVSLAKVKPPTGWRRRFDAAFFGFRDRQFMTLARKALDYPGATLCAAIGGMVVAGSLIASQHVGVALVTGFDIEGVQADVQFSDAASDDDKRDFLAHLESTLVDVDETAASPNLLGWMTKLNRARFNGDGLSGEQYGSVAASYAYEESRSLTPETFVARWRERIVKPPYVEQLVVAVEGGQNNGQPDITLVLSGDDLDLLKQGAEELTHALAAYPGVSNVIDNLPYGREQIIFQITPLGRTLGLTAEAIGSQLRAAYSGARVQIFNEQDSELEVRVMLPDAERDDLARLRQFPIRTPAGEFVPLANVAELDNRRGIDIIRHHNGRMAISVNADVDPRTANALAITADVEAKVLPEILDRYNLTFGLGGKSEHDQVILGTMALGGLLTLILIYLILAWVFSSYLWPVAIMAAIPFGLTGAVLGHWVTGWDVGAMSLLAFFSLTGIVVNDSIVLISFFKRDLEAGMTLRAALENAVQARFRAVILTSLTTIAGLLPLMFETSTLSFYVAPIAVTLCFGLGFATLLVLVVIPALILMLESQKGRAVWLRDRLLTRVRPYVTNHLNGRSPS